MQDLGSFIATSVVALVSALIGGAGSYFGATRAAQKQIEALYKQEKELRTLQEKQQERAALKALSAELKESISLSTRANTNAFPLISTDVWDSFKGYLLLLPDSLQGKILAAYQAIRLYNGAREDFIHGTINPTKMEEVYRLRDESLKACLEAEQALDAHLNSKPTVDAEGEDVASGGIRKLLAFTRDHIAQFTQKITHRR